MMNVNIESSVLIFPHSFLFYDVLDTDGNALIHFTAYASIALFLRNYKNKVLNFYNTNDECRPLYAALRIPFI